MNLHRIIVSSALAFGVALSVSTTPRAAIVESTDLFAKLPAGDAVATIDVPAMLTKAIPAVLADRPDTRKRFDENIARLKSDFGLDLATVRRIAVSGSPLNYTSSDWVALLDGSFDNVAQPGVLEKSLAGYSQRNTRYSFRTEAREGMTLYVIPETLASGRAVDRFAVAVLDAHTIAWGTPGGVRGAIDVHKGKAQSISANAAVLEAYAASPAAVPVRFGLVIPADVVREESVRDKDNPLWKTLGGIRFLFGSLGIEGQNAVALRLTARSATAENARDAAATFDALISLGKATAKDDLATLISLVTVTTVGNDVTAGAVVPPAHQDVLFRQVFRLQ